MASYVCSQKVLYPPFGVVQLKVSGNARRFTARWAGGTLVVVVPPRTSADEVRRALGAMEKELMANRPRQFFTDDMRIGPEDFNLHLYRSTRIPRSGAVIIDDDGDGFPAVCFGADLDLANPGVEKFITKAIMRVCDRRFDDLLLKPASRTVAELNLAVRPKAVQPGTGFRRLGLCTSEGVITLSKALCMAPPQLRHYVICHELAHLTYMDHSAAFKALLDRYLDGRRVALERLQRSFRFPVPS